MEVGENGNFIDNRTLDKYISDHGESITSAYKGISDLAAAINNNLEEVHPDIYKEMLQMMRYIDLIAVTYDELMGKMYEIFVGDKE